MHLSFKAYVGFVIDLIVLPASFCHMFFLSEQVSDFFQLIVSALILSACLTHVFFY